MESLVEECFQEMESVDNCNEGIEVSVITFTTSSVVEGEMETVNNHEEDTRLSVITTSSLLRHTDPEFDLTFEEEFKIHELVVRKESLFDTLICLLLKVPHVSWLFSKFLAGPHTPTRPGIGPFIWSFLKEGVPKIWDVILNNLEEGGQIRACLDMFDEYKNVEETAKKETFQFSLRVLQICTRAFLLVHCDKETWEEQARATGIFSRGMLDTFFDKHPSKRPPFDPLNVPLFASPWAENITSEQFFATTVEELGRAVGSDQGLATLYTTLILVTPGAQLSQATKENPTLKRVQNEMALLIFRFLKKKLQNVEEARARTSLLLKLVGDLHQSRNILARAYPL